MTPFYPVSARVRASLPLPRETQLKAELKAEKDENARLRNPPP